MIEVQNYPYTFWHKGLTEAEYKKQLDKDYQADLRYDHLRDEAMIEALENPE
jgi:hypothetical protein